MPVKIKKEKMKPLNKKYRIAVIIGMVIAIAFAIFFSCLLAGMTAQHEAPAIVMFCVFCVYLADVLVNFVLGIRTYIKEDNTAVLLQSVMIFANIIFCLLNLKTFLMLLLVVLKKHDAVFKLLDGKTYLEYITTQYGNWVCLIIGVVISMILGVLAILELARNKK